MSRTVTATSVSTQDVTITTTASASTASYSSTEASYSSIETVTGSSSDQVFYRSGNGWNFSVTSSNWAVGYGGTIYVYVNLTNISGQTQKVQEMSPLVNPVLSCKSGPCGNPGAQGWAWNPPGGESFPRSFAPGQWEFSGPYPIPTSAFRWGGIPEGSLTLSIWPLIGPSGQALTVNATIGQALMINETIGVS